MPAADDGAGPIASNARRRLEAIRRALVLEMTQRLARLDTQGGKLSAEAEALDNARRIRQQVLALLREDGLPVVIGAAEAAVADAVDAAVLRAPAPRDPLAPFLSVTTEPESKDQIARSVSGVLDEVAAVFAGAEDEIRDAIDLGLSTSSPLAEVIADVAAKLDTTFAKASVAVDAAVRGAASTAIVDQAERGAEAAGVEMVYLYDGPDDGKKRDWCREHLGKAYTRAALGRLRNDDGDPALVMRGGFGCRDRWSPLPREDAEAEGIEVVE